MVGMILFAGRPGLQCGSHQLHRFVNVIEKLLVASAEVVQTVFTCRRFDKPVFRTTAVADKLHFTTSAVFGKCIAFIRPKFALERRIYHLLNSVFSDVANVIVRV